VAESIGLTKERRDAESGSGFSFADYQADLAGIALADSLVKRTVRLDQLSRHTLITDLIPPSDGLIEGLTWKEFTERFGTLTDQRFKQERERLIERIHALPLHTDSAARRDSNSPK
jgi:hypothetical protein